MLFGQTIAINGGAYSPTLDIGVIEVNTSTSPTTITLPNVLNSFADAVG